MHPLVFRREAEAEVLDAYFYYQQARSGLGKAFVEAVESAVVRIERTPLLHPRVLDDMRRSLLRRFPYAVYYEVLLGHVEVVSILHTRRDPRRWQRRRRSARTTH
jgi:toxin ParE1/3/4